MKLPKTAALITGCGNGGIGAAMAKAGTLRNLSAVKIVELDDSLDSSIARPTNTVDDILDSAKCPIWRGATSTACNSLSNWLPNSVSGHLNTGAKGIKDLRRYYSSNSSPPRTAGQGWDVEDKGLTIF
ncbi:hypothetical protein PG996_005375 [Apiospora saccharicola]|uniref:Uncharacterized protein n=1 Tax=Apiospora saccharicola TaxID=335842 RepID=A0ABR1VLK5_9PEZI